MEPIQSGCQNEKFKRQNQSKRIKQQRIQIAVPEGSLKRDECQRGDENDFCKYCAHIQRHQVFNSTM